MHSGERRQGESTRRSTPASSQRRTSPASRMLAAEADLEARALAPGFAQQPAQLPHARGGALHVVDQAVPAVAVLRRAAQRRRRLSAAVQRRPRLLERLGLEHHRPEVEELAVVLDDLLAPQPLADRRALRRDAARACAGRARPRSIRCAASPRQSRFRRARPRAGRASAPRARRRRDDAGPADRRWCRAGSARSCPPGSRDRRRRRRPASRAEPAGGPRPGCGEPAISTGKTRCSAIQTDSKPSRSASSVASTWKAGFRRASAIPNFTRSAATWRRRRVAS